MASGSPFSTRSIQADTGLAASMRVVVVEGASSRIVELPRNGSLVVGRGHEADVQVSDDAVSRKHVEILVVGEAITVADLGSHNGTKLNGEWLRQKRPFRPGDVVVFGTCALVLQPSQGAALGIERAVDLDALHARLATEVARALEYDRQLSIAVVWLSDVAAPGPKVLESVARALGPLDAVACDGDRRLAILMPEIDGDLARASIAEALASFGASFGASARVGIASFPDDGVSGDALFGAARAAADLAAPGAVARADDTVRRLTVGDQTILVADPAVLRLHELAERLAPSDLTVLIIGETGVGKEHVARVVHEKSPRAGGPFVAINCASIAESLAESELFGHERGAFSGALTSKKGLFEAADGGTLFLDEVGELSLPMQARLLRALETRCVLRVGSTQEQKVDVRVVAATHRALADLVKMGGFRQDLVFRLAGATISLPPLRERPRDVAVLARAFLADACARFQKRAMTISASFMHALIVHQWPGNVRELKNTMDYVAATAQEAVLGPWHLPVLTSPVVSGSPSEAIEPRKGFGERSVPIVEAFGFRPIGEEIRELEMDRMKQALEAADNNQTRAAALIGMPLRTFVTKLRVYGLR
jgi:DNA-binding NtrC family response regulator